MITTKHLRKLIKECSFVDVDNIRYRIVSFSLKGPDAGIDLMLNGRTFNTIDRTLTLENIRKAKIDNGYAWIMPNGSRVEFFILRRMAL